MSREETREMLIKLIEPLVEDLGFELIQLEYAAGKHGLLHLHIDREGGINIEHCELVSREVSDLLDRRDPIEHAYTLEVSSPGLERHLRKIEHFRRFIGEKVKLRTTDSFDGHNKLSGELIETGDDWVRIKTVDGDEIKVPLLSITRANLWYTGPEKRNFLKNSRKGGWIPKNE
ncbi:MAG: ribosome maturation factor RimP [Bacillota bacterium]|nr:ribosome maturation factor RimP [Bacillota bacterium]